MKSILTASACAAALAFAVPAMADTDSAKPTHHHAHHMSKMGPHTKPKKAGDPTTEELNQKSLDAAKGGSVPASGTETAPPASGATAPATAMPASPPAATAPGSGTTGTTTPGNAPSGGQ